MVRRSLVALTGLLEMVSAQHANLTTGYTQYVNVL